MSIRGRVTEEVSEAGVGNKRGRVDGTEKGRSNKVNDSIKKVELCGEYFFFQAEDGIRDRLVTGVQSVLFRSNEHCLQRRFERVRNKMFG